MKFSVLILTSLFFSLLEVEGLFLGFSRTFVHTKRLVRQQCQFYNSNNLAVDPIQFALLSQPSRLRDVPAAVSVSNNRILSEEEESEGEEDEEEEEGPKTAFEEGIVPAATQEISLIKQGLNISSFLNGSDVRVGIIMARWNSDIIQGLYKGVNESLTACSVKPSNVFTTYVPGSFELPITARFLAASKRVDVIICIGCLIKGETMHFEYIAQATASGIMQVSLESYVPCIFGVLTVLNKEQAIVRCTGATNEGLSWGKSAVEMGLARMSALGLDKLANQAKITGKDLFSASSNGTTTPGTGDKKEKKYFGF